jgi:hypothetical protein
MLRRSCVIVDPVLSAGGLEPIALSVDDQRRGLEAVHAAHLAMALRDIKRWTSSLLETASISM